MIVEILMMGCIALGALIALPPIFQLPIVKGGIAKLKGALSTPATPVVVPDVAPITPVPETPAVVVPTRSGLAHIVSEWEDFVNVLVDNGMEESAEDMKTLLNKMVAEYRSDLNEDDDPGVAMVDSIIAPSEEKGA